jgi:antitoxin YefM
MFVCNAGMVQICLRHCFLPFFTKTMLFTTTSDVHANFTSWCASALDDREIIVMQNNNGKRLALLAADELESLLETVHLLRSPANAERLLTALRRAEEQTESPETLQELRSSVGLEETA